jgi:hypothetical protein
MTDFVKSSGCIFTDLELTPPLTLSYKNWKGEVADRMIMPTTVWFGTTEWHPNPQWFLKGTDLEKREERDFAIADFGASKDQLIEQMAGALNFILAFYEPGQSYLDTNAWTRAEAGGRKALADAKAAGYFRA